MAEQVKCKRCFHLNNDWCIPKMDSPDPDIVRDCQYYIATTNGDRIRRMTNEELVEFFCDMIQDCVCNNVSCQKFCATKKTCEQAWFDWLNKECD